MSEATHEIVNDAAEKAYSFRPLQASDIFLMSKIIGKIGVNEFTACFEKDGVKDIIANMGRGKAQAATLAGAAVMLEIANVIFSNLPKCETEVYQMLANVTGKTEASIKKLDFITFTEMVIEFVKKEEFRDFIKVVSKLFK